MYIDPLKMKSGEAHSAGACQFYRELLRQAQVTESSGLFSAFLISAMTSKTARKNQKQHLGPGVTDWCLVRNQGMDPKESLFGGSFPHPLRVTPVR